VSISGGTVSAEINSFATAVWNLDGTMTISGGKVSAANGVAVENGGKLTVSGTAEVTSDSRAAISNSDSLEITGGTVKSGACTCYSGGGYQLGTVQNSGNGTVVVNGGTVENTYVGSAASVRAIYNRKGTVIINDGTVSATKGAAVYNTEEGTVIVNGGTVSATEGTAVYTEFRGTVIVIGGTVTGRTKYYNVDNTYDNGAIIEWTKTAPQTYTAYTSDDITKLPETATARWFIKDGKSGIDYANTNGTVKGFVPVSGVIVNKANPTITWPTAAAITYGAALSTSALSGGSNIGTFAWTAPATIPTVTNSGYSVTFTPADQDNFDWTGVTLTKITNITINKAQITKPSVTDTNLVYNSNVQSAGITANDAYTITGDTATNAGTYTATVALKDKNNYEWADGEDDDLFLNWSIAEAQTPIFSNRENPKIGRIGVQTIGNAILLSNLPSNAKVDVYNLQGKRIYSANPENPQILRIGVQTKGIYVIKIGNQTLRVAVK